MIYFYKNEVCCVAIDETRYNLNGINLHTDEQFLYCVATDGHRLSYIKRTHGSICVWLSLS